MANFARSLHAMNSPAIDSAQLASPRSPDVPCETAQPAFWETQYQTGDPQWDKGAPSPGLVDFLTAHPELRGGSVVVPGCGTGHDVRALARAGFVATGLDFAPSAIRLAIERTSAAGLQAGFQLCDFLGDPAPEPADWVFEHTLFCALPPVARDDYLRAVLRWLKPGGHYLAVNYMICDPDGPPWAVTREELLARFTPHFDRLADWLPRSYPNRVGKEWMFWWRRKAL